MGTLEEGEFRDGLVNSVVVVDWLFYISMVIEVNCYCLIKW